MTMAQVKYFVTTAKCLSITKAAELLQLTQHPIESIALSCGYTDPLEQAHPEYGRRAEYSAVCADEERDTADSGGKRFVYRDAGYVS